MEQQSIKKFVKECLPNKLRAGDVIVYNIKNEAVEITVFRQVYAQGEPFTFKRIFIGEERLGVWNILFKNKIKQELFIENLSEWAAMNKLVLVDRKHWPNYPPTST